MKAVCPDRLSVDAKSPFFDGPLLARGVGVRFNGIEKKNIHEYSVSEGWVRIRHLGRGVDRRGNPLLITLKGKVEPYIKMASVVCEKESS